MSHDKFQNKYRINSIRAMWHDYNGGAYFVTICTKKHKHFFGDIENDTMQLSEIGKLVTENLQNITNHYPYAEIPLFVVMPNHLHAIIIIDGRKTTYPRRNTEHQTIVETGRAPSLLRAAPFPQQTTPINKQMQEIDSFKGWLSVAVGGFKSATTKFAHAHNIDFAWQTRFHDAIIKNQTSMNEIAKYIENNVSMWNKDCFNKNNTH